MQHLKNVKMIDEPFVSVVIPTYNRKEMLEECLESLFNQNYPKDKYEIIVVNDGSDDGTTEVLEEYEERAPCEFKWFSQENKGAPDAINLAITNSKGEIICFTDDDCVADRNWIRNLIKGYEDGSVGGVGGRIIAYRLKNLIEKYSEERGFLKPKNVNQLFFPTANVSYRKDVLDTIGQIDRTLKISYDVDIGLRIILAGYKIRYSSDAIVYHNHRSSFKSLIKQVYGYGVGQAMLHKKYTKNFYPGQRILKLCARLILKIVTVPVKLLRVFYAEDKKLSLVEPFLDIATIAALLLGTAKETYFGREYKGQKYNKKLEFVEERSFIQASVHLIKKSFEFNR